MLDTALISIAAVLGLAVIVTGMTGRWRGNRAAYYSRPTVLALIGLFAGVSAWAFAQDQAAIAWVAAGVAAWIGLEALFALFKNSQAGDRLFSDPEPEQAQEPQPAADQPQPASAPATPAARRNPTPRGPQPVRKHRKRR